MRKSWGGSRPGAGRKSIWNSGDCKAVKIPVSLVDEVMRYAHTLDQGKADEQEEREINRLSAAIKEARAILERGLKEYNKGLRKSFLIADAKGALDALNRVTTDRL